MRAYTMPLHPHLIFSLHPSLYAVPALVVKQIIRLPEVLPLPEAPSYIVGIINLRGRVVPVMDLGVRLGHARRALQVDDSLIVIETDGALLGIIVNEVRQVRSMAEHETEEPPMAGFPGGVESGSRFLAGVAKIGGDVVMLLSLEHLFGLPVEELIPKSGLGAECLDDRDANAAGDFCPQATPKERATFRARAHKLRQPLSTGDKDGLMPLAVVGLSGEYFGIDLGAVRRFSALRAVTPVPCCSDHIVGQMNLRGEVLTVVDIRAALRMQQTNLAGERSAATKSKVVVIQSDSLHVGILVDEVLDVVNLQPAQVRPVPTGRLRGEEYLTGMAPYGDGMMGILDLPRIFDQGSLVVNQEV